MELEHDDTDAAGWGLAAALEALKADIARLHAGAAYPSFPITSVTLELKVVATRNRNGKAGFKVPFIQTELGGEVGRKDEAVSTITLQLGAPTDAQGAQVRVGDTGDKLKR